MAPMFLRGLRGVNLSCTSPASTAICSNNMEPPRKSSSRPPPPTTLSPTSSSRCLLDPDLFPDLDTVPDSLSIDPSRFHFGDKEASPNIKPKTLYLRSSSASPAVGGWVRFDEEVQVGRSTAKFSGAGAGAGRVLAKESGFSYNKPSQSLTIFHVGREDKGSNHSYSYNNGTANTTSAFKSSFSSRSRDQVVVLRVSLHCKGCEGKVRKHLSRMQGVTSFNIDFAAKKVTVIGDVTPLSVLSSISKVKNAQLWPSSATLSKLP